MVLEKVKKILCEEFDIDESEISLSATLESDLGIDWETDIFDLVMSLEDEFSIEITDEALEEISTLGDLISYIEENIE